MSEATQRALIKTIIDGVTNIGQTHNRERWSASWDGFLAHFKTTISGAAVIRGWTLTLTGVSAEPWLASFEPGLSLVKRVYRYKLRGYIGLNDADASETTAAALVESVLNALDGAETLHPDTPDADETPYAQLITLEPRMFGSVLCHYAEIDVVTVEEVTLTRS